MSAICDIFATSGKKLVTANSPELILSIKASSENLKRLADDSVGSSEMKSLSTLLIINSAGTTVKTLHGAGA